MANCTSVHDDIQLAVRGPTGKVRSGGDPQEDEIRRGKKATPTSHKRKRNPRMQRPHHIPYRTTYHKKTDSRNTRTRRG